MSNLEKIIEEYRPHFNEIYSDTKTGSLYNFEGILVAEDDYYYLLLPLNKEDKTVYCSCVGGIESFGFERV